MQKLPRISLTLLAADYLFPMLRILQYKDILPGGRGGGGGYVVPGNLDSLFLRGRLIWRVKRGPNVKKAH